VRSLVDQLAAAGIPETIQHDDLHDGQVFIRNGDYLVFDWGDAVVTHPFHTLTVTLRAAAWRLGLEPGGLEIIRLRDAYLEPFGRLDQLAPVAETAYRTGTLGRALA
jgi:aminoglycoside phosphotransferase (APT) family kinase protein